MDLYTDVSYELAEQLTKRYSTSFSLSSRLFDISIRKHIYAVYGMVRLADEIVDTYRSSDMSAQLAAFQKEVMNSLATGYSSNPIVHAFAHTARQYDISSQLIDPFFSSMHEDLTATQFTEKAYREYIYGSAEVVGLICLKVFVSGDDELYTTLTPAASALGAAYQKVNFLRDFCADFTSLGRVYFPNVTFESFDETAKNNVIKDIEVDFARAKAGMQALPKTARQAVMTSYTYYHELLEKLKTTPVEVIKTRRIRIPNRRKIWLLTKARLQK